MSVINDKSSSMRIDVTDEVRAVDAFMKDATPARKFALAAWYLRFMDQMPPELRRGIVEGAQQINLKSNIERR